MENIFISFLLIEVLFTTILIINCAMDELLPIKEYKKWSQNKNWFGKIYIFITIDVTVRSDDKALVKEFEDSVMFWRCDDDG